MDIWDIVKVVARRWVVSVPLLLITFGAMVFVAINMKPEYTATGNLRLLPPSVVQNPQNGIRQQVNPWDEDSLTDAAIVRLRNKAVHDQVEAAGYVGEWEADIDLAFSSVITIKTTAPTSEEAQKTTKYLMLVIAEDVKSRQSPYRLQSGEEVTTIAFDNGDSIEAETGKIKRALIAVFGAGAIVAAGAAVGLDSILRRRNPGLTVPTHAQQRALSLAGAPPLAGTPVAPVAAKNGGKAEKRPGINVTYLPTAGAPDAAVDDAQNVTVRDAQTSTIPAVRDDSTIILPLADFSVPSPIATSAAKDKPKT